MSKPKREFERHSGTGTPLKPQAKKSGGGQHNWGGSEEEIKDAVVAHEEEKESAAPTNQPEQPATFKPKDEANPENLGELQETEEIDTSVSYEEFMKQKQKQTNRSKAYDGRTVPNLTYRVDRYKGKNQHEKATDELLEGAQKEKKKTKENQKTTQSYKT